MSAVDFARLTTGLTDNQVAMFAELIEALRDGAEIAEACERVGLGEVYREVVAER